MATIADTITIPNEGHHTDGENKLLCHSTRQAFENATTTVEIFDHCPFCGEELEELEDFLK